LAADVADGSNCEKLNVSKSGPSTSLMGQQRKHSTYKLRGVGTIWLSDYVRCVDATLSIQFLQVSIASS
jgi:hypothetical protein